MNVYLLEIVLDTSGYIPIAISAKETPVHSVLTKTKGKALIMPFKTFHLTLTIITPSGPTLHNSNSKYIILLSLYYYIIIILLSLYFHYIIILLSLLEWTTICQFTAKGLVT